MRWHHRLYVALRGLFTSSALDQELNEELQFHFDRLVQANIESGMTPEQARRSAAIAIGTFDSAREQSRELRAGAWTRQFGRDLAFGMRLLKKAPGFSAAAIAIVALGVGAVTAIFSVVYGVLLRPLPFPDPDQLVQIWGRSPRYARDAVSAADRRDWEAETTAFEGIALYNAYANFNLIDGAGDPERLLGARISANSFAVLQVVPAMGRGFIEGEDEIGRERVVVLGDALWRRRFGADPRIIGKQIRLSGVPHEVIGVSAPGFSYPERPFDLLVPLTVNPKEFTREVSPFGLRSIARLKPGVTVADAQSQMNVVATRLADRYPMNKGVGVEVIGLQANLVGDVRTGLVLMFAAVAALLFVAALNLAGLLSARAAARSRELAVRLALGATRQRIILQCVAEVMPLLAIGGALGVAAAAIGVRYFVAAAPPTMPRLDGIAVDGAVLTAAFIVLTMAGTLASTLPAAQAWRADLAAMSGDGSRGATRGPAQTRVRNVLVAAQIALSLPLLVGAVLLTRSFASVVSIDPGFKTEQVVSMHLAIPRSKYTSDERIAEFEGRMLERTRNVPGVATAALVNRLPLAGVAQNAPVEFEDRPSESTVYGRRVIAADYFTTMGIPLIEGRGFNAGDTLRAPLVAVVDERVARRQWPGSSPIGKRVRFPARGAGNPPSPWMEVVGVVGHVKHNGLDQDSTGEIYWDYRQMTQDRAVIVARTLTDPWATIAAIIAAIRELDPEQPVYDARTLDQVLARSVEQRWVSMVLLGSFASMALFLCCIGVYGVIGFGVTRQRREFGIRLALGASRGGIVTSVLARGLAMAAIGVAVGLVLSVVLTRGMTSMLFGVATTDSISFASATAALVLAVAAASFLPARRAAAVDPAVTLRCDC